MIENQNYPDIARKLELLEIRLRLIHWPLPKQLLI